MFFMEEDRAIYIERKQDLSLYHFIKDLFSDVDGIHIEDGYPNTPLVLPSISVEGSTLRLLPFELGNRSGYETRSWYIDVFAENKSRRDEFAYRILHSLENIVSVYNYDEGFPPDVSPTRIGCLRPEELRLEIIKIMPQLVEKLYYRASISFVATYEEII